MKTLRYIYWVFLALIMATSCQDDEPSLGKKLDPSEIDFQVIQDFEESPGGNMVILRNNTPGTVAMWDYGTGRSNRQVDTIYFAFTGQYQIKFSAMTAGGVVEMEPVVIDVTEDDLTRVNHVLWTNLTGGVGQSKTWILDNGKYGLAVGPLAYADPAKNQFWGDYEPNWEPAAGDVGISGYETAEMTFSLIDGPFIQTVKPNEGGITESGTFFLDVDNHTLTTTDATIIRPANFIANASNWNSNLRVLELTENQLKVAVLRTNSEGPWWYILNYVSKEYAENYVPEAQPDPNFDFGNQMAFLAGTSATTWKMSTESPFNWMNLNAAFLNNWNTVTDYPGWTGYDAAAVSNIDNVRLTFYKTGDFVLTKDDGSEQRGFFSVNEPKNLVTFEGIKPSIYISGGWVTATTTDYFEDEGGNVITGDNQWKIVKTKTISGVTTEVWFGKRDTAKKEYMVYHFVLASGIPDVRNEMIKALAGKATGTSSRTFKIDTNWPVDWTTLDGVGWTVAGTQDGWYWNAEATESVKNQTLTFSQTDGVVTVTKKDAAGVVTTSPVTIDPVKRAITIPDTDIIKFGGAANWLPTDGPEYRWAKGEFNEVETEGMWIGMQSNTNEITAYHYILK